MRPLPPETIGQFADGKDWADAYIPAPEVLQWAMDTFVIEGAPLFNEDHAHLKDAPIAFLWAAGGFEKQGRWVLGQCEGVTFRCGAWQKGRQEQQMLQWFGYVPSFLITLAADYCSQCSDAEFCALVEHELFHIAQKTDEFGAPKFRQDGMPSLCLRAHDVSEFVGIVERYGVGHPDGDLARMVEAAKSRPTVSAASIASACGTCLLRVV